MKIPMPSPRGTNHARLFVTTNQQAAYDEKLPEDVGAELLAFLAGKLSDEDLQAFCKMAGIDAGAAMDEPEPFKDMPKTNAQAADQARARAAVRAARMSDADRESFSDRFPGAARIKVG